MKKINKHQIFITVILLLFVSNITVAQKKSDETILTNSSIIELVKAGLSESVILAKIKNSKCEFDTSSSALVSLKENGVSDNIITAIIEAKSNDSNSIQADTSRITPLEMKDAVGTQKFFIESEDERSQLELAKKLKEKGFEIVSNKQNADLVFVLSIEEKVATRSVGLLGGVQTINKVGKLSVYLQKENNTQLIFARGSEVISLHAIVGVAPVYRQAESMLKDFFKELKKAGDKIK